MLTRKTPLVVVIVVVAGAIGAGLVLAQNLGAGTAASAAPAQPPGSSHPSMPNIPVCLLSL